METKPNRRKIFTSGEIENIEEQIRAIYQIVNLGKTQGRIEGEPQITFDLKDSDLLNRKN